MQNRPENQRWRSARSRAGRGQPAAGATLPRSCLLYTSRADTKYFGPYTDSRAARDMVDIEMCIRDRLMTVHAAKGLEFAHVFLCSMTEGVLPSRKTDTPQGMEEERRLAFVAMTRARDGLYLTEAEGRGREG